MTRSFLPGIFVSLSLSVLSVLAIRGRADAQWVLAPTGTVIPLSAVTARDESTLVAVGARGTVLVRTRSARQWTPVSSGTMQWLSDICFPTRTRGFIVGWNGTMLATSDAGATWAGVVLPTSKSLAGIAFSSERLGVAVGLSGTLMRTSDGGATWASVPKIEAELRGVAWVNDSVVVACGLAGTLIRSSDGGLSWSRIPLDEKVTLYRVRMRREGKGYMVGEKGLLMVTENGGLTWKKITLETTSDLWDVWMSSSSLVFVVGGRGEVFFSTNGGNSWAWQGTRTSEDLRGIALAGSSFGAAVGSAGTALLTHNAGGCVRFPFPQNSTYRYGIMSSNRNHRDAQKSYLTWKRMYVTADSACGYRRVLFDDMSSTTSEGIGYGMLMAVNFNDRPLFDDLWNYYKRFTNETGLMQWHISSSCEVIGDGAATDADEDVAFALLLADRQWCSDGEINYRAAAVDLINRIWQHEVEPGTFVLKPGDGTWGGSHILNPSYFAPAYYRAFEAATGNAGWRKVIQKCYEILRKAAHPRTGLVPDWCRADGSPAQGREGNYYYYWDAARTPWRIALDYLWYGSEEAKAFCAKIAQFADSIGAPNLANGYYLDGKPMRNDATSVFIGAFGIAGMAAGPAYQQFCDTAYRLNVATVPPMERNYYNWSLRTLTLLVQTGNFLGPPDAPRR